jgi:hypothetical protein
MNFTELKKKKERSDNRLEVQPVFYFILKMPKPRHLPYHTLLIIGEKEGNNMPYGYPYSYGYPAPYPYPYPPPYSAGGGAWYAFFIVILVLVLIFGGWWYFSEYYR